MIDRGDGKVVAELASVDEYFFASVAKAVYVRAVCCPKKSPVRSSMKVLFCWGDDRYKCAAIDQPSPLVVLILNED